MHQRRTNLNGIAFFDVKLWHKTIKIIGNDSATVCLNDIYGEVRYLAANAQIEAFFKRYIHADY
jgi:hypothetical protein